MRKTKAEWQKSAEYYEAEAIRIGGEASELERHLARLRGENEMLRVIIRDFETRLKTAENELAAIKRAAEFV